MSEGGEKTEQPTPKKERDARAKGQVPRSQEVVTTFSLFGTIIAILALGDYIWSRLTLLIDQVADLSTRMGPQTLNEGLTLAIDASVSILVPILATTFILGVAANYIQFGSLFTLDTVTPKLEKVSPLGGIKRIFSMKSVVELLKSVIKITFLGVLLYYVIKGSVGPFISAVGCGMDCMAAVTNEMMLRVVSFTALAFLVVAVADLFWQRHSHTKSLMMSKEEVKREYKESEGDPHIKGQRREIAMEMAMSDGRKQVSNASALVVNPTHIAVALRYRQGETPLPIVTAKGMGAVAVDMRAEAERSGVPVFHNVILARRLFAETDPNQFVPDDVFDVVVEILAWIARNEDSLYKGQLRHGVLDMERGDHHEGVRQAGHGGTRL